jgi:hypothetical protein
LAVNDYRLRGHYLVTREPITVPEGWTATATTRWSCLTRTGDAVHAVVGPGGPDLVLIGYIIDPAGPSATDADILRSLRAGYEGPGSITAGLHGLSGRFVLLVDAADETYVFHDACGLRAVYHQRTDQGPVIASDPAVLVHLLGAPLTPRTSWRTALARDDVEWWLPSGMSLVDGVGHLPPNHFLRCSTGVAERFYPYGDSAAFVGEGGVVASAAALLRGSVAAAAHRWRLALAITAGVDSRTVLAASREHIDDIALYTLQLGPGSTPSPDVRIGGELARAVGAEHQVLRPSAPSPEFAEAFEQSTVSAHYDRRGANIWSTAQAFPDTVVLNGNGLEVARCFYYAAGTHAPVTDAGRLLDLVTGWRSVDAIADRMREWLADANNVCETIDVLDLFYWEHRMGGWASQNFMESGIAHEVFPPFNNRALLESLLTVPAARRHAPDYPLFRELWRAMWPELLEPPVNPGAPLAGVKGLLTKTGLLGPATAAYRALRGARS